MLFPEKAQGLLFDPSALGDLVDLVCREVQEAPLVLASREGLAYPVVLETPEIQALPSILGVQAAEEYLRDLGDR